MLSLTNSHSCSQWCRAANDRGFVRPSQGPRENVPEVVNEQDRFQPHRPRREDDGAAGSQRRRSVDLKPYRY